MNLADCLRFLLLSYSIVTAQTHSKLLFFQQRRGRFIFGTSSKFIASMSLPFSLFVCEFIVSLLLDIWNELNGSWDVCSLPTSFLYYCFLAFNIRQGGDNPGKGVHPNGHDIDLKSKIDNHSASKIILQYH